MMILVVSRVKTMASLNISNIISRISYVANKTAYVQSAEKNDRIKTTIRPN